MLTSARKPINCFYINHGYFYVDKCKFIFADRPRVRFTGVGNSKLQIVHSYIFPPFLLLFLSPSLLASLSFISLPLPLSLFLLLLLLLHTWTLALIFYLGTVIMVVSSKICVLLQFLYPCLRLFWEQGKYFLHIQLQKKYNKYK